MNTTPTSIHPETAIGYVHLIVSHLGRSLAFYQDILGFRLRQRDGDTTYLHKTPCCLLQLIRSHNGKEVAESMFWWTLDNRFEENL